MKRTVIETLGFTGMTLSSVPAHVEMMGLIGMGNNPMVGASSAVAVALEQVA